MERRAGTKGNADQQSTRRTQEPGKRVTGAGTRTASRRETRKEKFTALFHHSASSMLREAFFALKTDAAPGVDGLTWKDYEADLERNLEDLHDRVQRGAYRALPSRRRFTFPSLTAGSVRWRSLRWRTRSSNGRWSALLNAIYEEDFLGFSYGFRPGRGTHDALDALCVGICQQESELHTGRRHPVASSMRVSHDWLIRFVEHRIGDPAHHPPDPEMAEGGRARRRGLMVSDRGTGQGSVISPLLANVYLHYAFDLWAERWRRREATGDMIIVRYADDCVPRTH